MAKYKTGIESRRRILESARRLFYQNGFAKTTVASIAIDAGVPKELIAYYYKKEELLTAIHKKYVMAIFDAIDRQLGCGISLMHRYLLFMQLFCRGIYCDEKNLALYRYIVEEGLRARDIQELVDDTIRRVLLQYRPSLSYRECKMLISAQFGAHKEVARFFLTPDDPVASRRLFFWTGTVALRLAGVETDIIETEIAAAEELLGEMDTGTLCFTV